MIASIPTIPMVAKRAVRIVTTLLTLVVIPRIAMAHPMGNFSINHYTKVIIETRAIRLDYIIDMAEIPTFQESQRSAIRASPDDPALAGYLAQQSESFRQGLTLVLDGRPMLLRTIARKAIFPPGAGGLPTMKLGFVYEVQLPTTFSAPPQSIHYQDDNFPGRAGWKEIVAINGSGVNLVKASVPEQDRSLELTNYPTDLLHSPPQVLQADVSFKAGVPAPGRDEIANDALNRGWLTASSATFDSNLPLNANRQSTPRSAFTELIKSNRVDLAFLLTAALIAAVLGGFHALEPGHGKTLVAAYLVGSHGKARHAVMLGGIVTVSHTISVYVLGIITLYASQWIMPEQLYPWLGMVSGVVVAGLGLTLFMRRYLATQQLPHNHRELSAQTHDHSSSQAHNHDQHDHEMVPAPPHRHTWWGGHVHSADHHGHEKNSLDHEHANHGALPDESAHGTRETPSPLSLKSLFALGVTGGIVPCPAALVVLLGALAFHRIVFGLFLIVAFSAGLAAVLISCGLAMLFAGRFMSRFGERGPLTERWLPLASSAVITIVGVTLTLQSLVSAGLLHTRI